MRHYTQLTGHQPMILNRCTDESRSSPKRGGGGCGCAQGHDRARTVAQPGRSWLSPPPSSAPGPQAPPGPSPYTDPRCALGRGAGVAARGVESGVDQPAPAPPPGRAFEPRVDLPPCPLGPRRGRLPVSPPGLSTPAQEAPRRPFAAGPAQGDGPDRGAPRHRGRQGAHRGRGRGYAHRRGIPPGAGDAQ